MIYRADLIDASYTNDPKLLTFTYDIFLILRVTGLEIGAQLRLRSAIVFRAVSSLGAYFIMALWYTLINLAFGVSMEGTFGKSGFVVYWMLNTCTMGAGEESWYPVTKAVV